MLQCQQLLLRHCYPGVRRGDRSEASVAAAVSFYAPLQVEISIDWWLMELAGLSKVESFALVLCVFSRALKFSFSDCYYIHYALNQDRLSV
jgi:hypothetical protein